MKAVLERIPRPLRSPVVVYPFKDAPVHSPYHYHPEAELNVILKGRGRCLIGDHLGTFKPGDMVLLGPNLPHSYFPESKTEDKASKTSGMVLQFTAEIGSDLLRHTPEWNGYRSLLKRASRGILFSSEMQKKILPHFKQLVDSAGSRRLQIFLEMVDLLVLDDKARSIASLGFQSQINQEQAQRIERVCAWMTRHFQEPITLEQAAKEAHMSRVAFSRFFHRATTCCFITYLTELRISYACRQLLDTDHTIVQIAFESGFENLSNFNRHFREINKTTPSRYRALAGRSECDQNSDPR